MGSEEEILQAAAGAAAATAGLRLLLLFGSRATGTAHSGSDWDFGYLAEPSASLHRLHGELIQAVNSERVDLVNLATASGVLRYRAAASGQLLFEREAGEHRRFRLAAVDFWCDAEPVLAPALERVLERLGR